MYTILAPFPVRNYPPQPLNKDCHCRIGKFRLKTGRPLPWNDERQDLRPHGWFGEYKQIPTITTGGTGPLPPQYLHAYGQKPFSVIEGEIRVYG